MTFGERSKSVDPRDEWRDVWGEGFVEGFLSNDPISEMMLSSMRTQQKVPVKGTEPSLNAVHPSCFDGQRTEEGVTLLAKMMTGC